MNNRIVITLGKKTDYYQNAFDLGCAFFNTRSVDVIEFSEDKPNFFAHISDDQLSEIVFLGHGDRRQFEKYSARTFAARFNKAFEASRPKVRGAQLKELKKSITHVYLVGCEIGLIDHNGRSYAQDVAALLFDKGFVNIQVHAYSAVQTSKHDSLIVGVFNQEGTEGMVSRVSEFVGDAAGKPMVKVGNLKATMIDEKTKEARELLAGAAPKQELDKPVNTFGPARQSLTERRTEVNKKTIEANAAWRAKAVAVLRERHQYLKDSNKHSFKGLTLTVKLAKLNGYIEQLNGAAKLSDDTWLRTTKDILAEVGKSTLFKAQGFTMNLVRAICNDDHARVAAIAAQQKEKIALDKSRNDSHEQSSFMTSIFRTRTSVSHDPNAESNNRHSPPLVKDTLSRDLLKRIQDQITALEEEIEEINASCFSFFRCYEINTKIEKHTALRTFFDETTNTCLPIEQIYEAALAASQNDRVMRSKKTSRTKQLIEDILTETAKLLDPAERPNEDTRKNSTLLDKKRR